MENKESVEFIKILIETKDNNFKKILNLISILGSEISDLYGIKYSITTNEALDKLLNINKSFFSNINKELDNIKIQKATFEYKLNQLTKNNKQDNG